MSQNIIELHNDPVKLYHKDKENSDFKLNELHADYLPQKIEVNNNLQKPQQKLDSFNDQLKDNSNKLSKNQQKNYHIELVWKNLNISSTKPIKNKKNPGKSATKKILNNLYGKVQSGEALAILGGSGAGKTTLLNYLSKKIVTKNMKIEGDILLNNSKSDSRVMNSLSSYVMQDDVLEATMTPTEILLFTAKLKLHNLTDQEIEQKVLEMIKKLNLENAKNTRIGNNLTRGVSGGERKRTSIAVELISDPQIIFLDEPTTGLDSFNAFKVVENICDLAKKDYKLVIFTIHQPSSEIFGLLDKICILADGRNIYFGPRKDCLDCFDNLFHLPCKENYNPFEHFMEMTTLNCIFNEKVREKYHELKITHQDSDDVQLETYSNHIQNISSKFENDKEKYIADESNAILSEELKEVIQRKNKTHGFFFEFKMLFGRNMLIGSRNSQVLYFKIFQNIFTAILISIIFKNLSNNFSGIQDTAGIIFLLLVNSILGASTSSILIFSEERKVFLKERSNQLYSVFSYFLAKVLGEIPIFFIIVNCLIAIIYFATNLNDTFTSKYYYFNGIIQLSSICGASYAFFLGSLVENQEALTNLNTFLLIPMMILCGFFASSDNYAPYLKPLEYLSAFKYSYQINTESIFTDHQPFNCQNNNNLLCDPLRTRFTYTDPTYVSIIMIPVITIFFNTLAFLGLFFKTRIRD